MTEPLTDGDLGRINENLNQLKVADEQIKLAIQAGIDVSELQSTVAEQRNQLLKIKQTYFPGS